MTFITSVKIPRAAVRHQPRGPVGGARLAARLWPTCVAVLSLASALRGQELPLLLDNFEAGVGKWQANDWLADEIGAAPTLCSVAVEPGGPPGTAGQQCARLRFQQADRGWASLSIPVDGSTIARRKLGQVALWLKGTPGSPPLQLVLRAVYDNPATGRRDLDVPYAVDLPTDEPQWRRVVLPFGRFQTKYGKPLGESDLPHITTLQFVQEPAVAAASFLADDVALEPEGYVRPTPEPAPEPEPKPPPLAPARLELPDALSFDVDFRSRGPAILLQFGVSLPADVSPLVDPASGRPAVLDAIRGLAPCVVRMKLSSFYRPEGERAADGGNVIDRARLEEALRWIVTAGAKPLLCLDHPPSEEMTTEAFAELCRELAASLAEKPGSPHYEVWDEPIFRERFASVQDAAEAYCIVARAVKEADPHAKVGGIGFADAWADSLGYFIRVASPLDFLSLHFYGAHTTSSSNASLFAAALAGRAADLPRQLSFQDIRRLLRRTHGSDVELYLTEVNLNSARDREGRPRDSRIREPFAGAWLAALVASAGPYVDKLLWHTLYGDGWGLLNLPADRGGEQGETTFPWLAARAMDTYAPRGGSLCRLEALPHGALLCATRSGVIRSAICVIASDDDVAVRLKVSGLDGRGAARAQFINAGRPEMRSEVLPEGAKQEIEMNGPGIAVVQFIGAR